MDLLTNPLFGAVTFLVGSILGFFVGRWDRTREWDRREKLLRDTQSTSGCWVKGQIDAGTPPEL